MSTIDSQTLAERLPDEELVVVDIRHDTDYADWHIPGSRNIDVYDEVRNDPDAAKAALRDLPRDAEYVTVCGIGIVSQEATDLLRELGYEARNLEAGMVGWSQVHDAAAVPADLPDELLQIARPGKGCLSYMLVSDGEAAVFDPSQYIDEYVTRLQDREASLIGVYETHAQGDHLSGGPALAERFDVPYHLHPKDDLGIDATPISDGDIFHVGDIEVAVIHTPGHSPGGVTFAIEDEALLSGDTLFHDSVGRVELGATAGLDDAEPERNAETLYTSLQRLLERGNDPLVLPAHDPGSPRPPVAVRVSEVRARNRDLGMDQATFVGRVGGAIREPPSHARQIKRANVGLDDVDPADRTTIELGPNRCAAE
jgi:glyoxylase-like metal-dependent hydrolase (beta-lactamase superfamily II)